MAEKKQAAKYDEHSYHEYFRKLSEKYADLPVGAIQSAFRRAATFSAMYTNNPFIQNRRVKGIGSLPVEYGKDKIADMLQKPDENEIPLRQVSNILEYTAYPMLKIRTVYQDLLTYHYYIYPEYLEEADAKKPEFIREWRLMCKLATELQARRSARMIVGQCVRDGKVFYYPRIEVDKAHNVIKTALMQQLPQDWIKIAGFNNISKYTIAFNMFYFLQPGTTIYQFGDLFEPFLGDFLGMFETKPRVSPKGVIYASKDRVSMRRALDMQKRMAETPGTPEVYQENGRWFYWVYLPVDKVWSFEIDDVKPNVVSPLTGLFLSMAQIAQYEQVQLEIVQNPLVSILLGQMETYDAVSPTEADPIKVSDTGRQFFEALFYQMLNATNTGGIGIYPAPFKDMKLASLPESPNANSISAAGYEYAMEKSGMSALIPTTSDARAGVAQISLRIESRYAQHIYWQFGRMMDLLMERLNPKWEWRFKMFGDIATDETMHKEMRDGMTLGILPSAMKYAALNDMSLLDDMSISNAVIGLDIMNKRLPLISSFSAKQGEGTLPPYGEHPDGGRPKNEGDITTGGNEQDVDDGAGANAL